MIFKFRAFLINFKILEKVNIFGAIYKKANKKLFL